MTALPQFARLDNKHVSLILNCQTRVPSLVYYGKRLTSNTTPEMLALLGTRQEAKCAPIVEAPVSLLPSYGDGFTGAPGIEIFGQGQTWAVGVSLTSIEQNDTDITLVCTDSLRGVEVELCLTLDPNTSVVTLQSSLRNTGESSIGVNYFAAPTVPIGQNYRKLKTFEGRWSNEFQTQDIDLFMGSYVRENRRGKTSHDTFPGLITMEAHTTEQQGQCIGFHLGISGNHKLRAEKMADDRNYVQFGELLLPDELHLASGESYSSPVLYMAYSQTGLTDLSANFHQYVRNQVIKHDKPRPVHYNTWEGIYFDHDVDTLKSLADEVAPLGVERFVLDDGWFKGRRNDKAGLGDWVVDKDIYPQGLAPLINHVNDLGMEFGIWFEPEMVNPDSDLYRTHPEWVLASDNNPQIGFRHQYVLDLSNPDVIEYLFNNIHAILVEYPQISYIKWDMNRDVNHQCSLNGKPAMHQQIRALYQLIQRIKDAHPGLEIESCCSGGGRVDLGILQHTDRFWTSDTNDALDRLSIQRGCSFFFPAEIMGAHVGPRDCHITGRRVSMETRAAVAMFGHMGIEMDPRELTAEEKVILTTAIEQHKAHRELIHTGKLVRLDDNGLSIDFGIVSQDQNQALFTYNSVKETPRTNPARLIFKGLNPKGNYRLTRLWPEKIKEYSESISEQVNGQIFSGDALMEFGLQMPIVDPQTSLVFKLEAE